MFVGFSVERLWPLKLYFSFIEMNSCLYVILFKIEIILSEKTCYD